MQICVFEDMMIERELDLAVLFSLGSKHDCGVDG